ncbi:MULTISPECIES: DUF2155 domain-containing protein [unclassified Brevundimonas]|jgi:hypothetical protein|uniref:DUF2155 domain-containing protein n=1 Tax=unclassified Brevundimonas TaxID=2622653 RepID=UPI000C522BBC|nr:MULTISPECIES: DUF2155 domain-containing protein [unclassified Brevundimonas]MAL87480.1 hypothetical protein [Brevundimonas sp.]|tara:strand:+ start:12932 stop:13633 length:702 start_codon:yes stop_codon:yes gene_type:complete
MKRPARILGLVVAATMAVGGVGVTAALNDRPEDARPIQDPPANPAPAQDPAQTNSLGPTETAPNAQPAPAAPVPVPPTPEESTAALNRARQGEALNEIAPPAEEEDEEEEVEVVQAPTEPEGPPPPRQRRRVAVVQAVDKVTAESIRFEVEVGGRPVAFKRELIFRVRACEVSTEGERDQEAAGYLEISLQPRGVITGAEPRQLFRGWMFASSPGLGVLEHPVYDAWLVDCRA